MASYKIRTAGNCPAVLFTIKSPFNIRIGHGNSLPIQLLQAEPFFSAATEIRIGRERSLPPRLLPAELLSIAAKKISIGRGRSLSLLLLQAEPFLFAATKIRIGRGPRCYNASDFLQRFPSSSLKSRIAARKRANPGHSLQRFPISAQELAITAAPDPFSWISLQPNGVRYGTEALPAGRLGRGIASLSSLFRLPYWLKV